MSIICFVCFLPMSSSACPVGQFKWGTEGQCRGCPGFSHATIRGASVCTCIYGYLRAESDPPDTPCTSKCAGNMVASHVAPPRPKPPMHFLTLFYHLCCLWCHLTRLLSSALLSIVSLLGFEMHFFCDRSLAGRGLSLRSGVGFDALK